MEKGRRGKEETGCCKNTLLTKGFSGFPPRFRQCFPAGSQGPSSAVGAGLLPQGWATLRQPFCSGFLREATFPPGCSPGGRAGCGEQAQHKGTQACSFCKAYRAGAVPGDFIANCLPQGDAFPYACREAAGSASCEQGLQSKPHHEPSMKTKGFCYLQYAP